MSNFLSVFSDPGNFEIIKAVFIDIQNYGFKFDVCKCLLLQVFLIW